MKRKDAADILVRFGNRLRELRVNAGKSQERLAREVGMAAENVSRTENGHGEQGPSLIRVHELARALGTTAADLVGE